MPKKQYVAYNLSGDIVPMEKEGGGSGIDEEARAAAAAAQYTADTAQSTATAAQDTAATAQTTADTAQSTANTAQTTANAALEEVKNCVHFDDVSIAQTLEGFAGNSGASSYFFNVVGNQAEFLLDLVDGAEDLHNTLRLVSSSSFDYNNSEGIVETTLIINNFMEFNLTTGVIYFYKGTPLQKTLNLFKLAS